MPERTPNAASGDPLVDVGEGIRADLKTVMLWLKVLAAIVAVGAAVAVMMSVLFLLGLGALGRLDEQAADLERNLKATQEVAKTTQEVATELADCTTPSERDAQGNVIVRHDCYERLRTPQAIPGVTPAMQNVDCLVRRALEGLPPPVNFNDCPAG